ncbi:hsp70-Hsp90 organizing protein [Ornithorhynchus anatinus]|uniref:Tetratricopeptide repeat domain 31 n=1 Tax=Ornithorhynchus anatinus TaxID=9258 RepID=F6WSZ4_ORNAN|nr:hsp70-Hsp90 organizing protein [Ornithorhynchus anatinus]XP_028915962.1 hsp70-Hsp90 organizing protein [Ornithorhynchus anatinus]
MECGKDVEASGSCAARTPSRHSRFQEEEINLEEHLSKEERAKQKAEKQRAKKKRQRERRKLGRKGHEDSEQEPEWDVNSAFVANAASHIKSRYRPKQEKKSRENKDSEHKAQEDDGPTLAVQRSRQLAEKGIDLVKRGNFSQAVEMFSEAIQLDPKDYRYFGNRSYCYEQLKKYEEALLDAETSIQLSVDWPKGYFRKGKALLGSKKHSDAEAAFEMVLRFDEGCHEAVKEILTCRVLSLMEAGFTQVQSVSLLEEFETVPAVLQAPIAAQVLERNSSSCLEEAVVCLTDQPKTLCASLWVGNITMHVKEKHLKDLFKSYGEIASVRVLHERFCAFVNFKCPSAAARALDSLQGKEIENTKLLIRYPDKQQRCLGVNPSPAQTKPGIARPGSRRKGPVKGNECYFWRTTGCHFGEKCHYRHVPEHRGVDRKPWQS